MLAERLRQLKTLSASPEARRAALIGCAAVLAALCALLFAVALRQGGFFDAARSNGLGAVHEAAERAIGGELRRAYDEPGRPFLHPPALPALLLPLGFLSSRAAVVLLALLCLGALLWTFRVLDRVLCPPLGGFDKFLGFLLAYRFLASDFARGELVAPALAIVTAGFLLERRGRSAAAGLVIALAASIKVFPLLLLPWMLRRGRLRMAAGFLGGLLLWWLLVPGTIAGREEYLESVAAWWRVHRAQVFPATAGAWTHLAAAAALLAVSMVLLGRGRARRPWSGAEISAALLIGALFFPGFSAADLAALLPAAACGFAAARTGGTGPGRARRFAAAAWGGAFALAAFTAPLVIGAEAAARSAAWALPAAGLLLLAPLHFDCGFPASGPDVDSGRSAPAKGPIPKLHPSDRGRAKGRQARRADDAL